MEDAIYRASSQHKLWSFTPESLSGVRKATNAAAAAQVREAIMRAREKKTMNDGAVRNGNGNGNGSGVVDSDVGTPADGGGNGNGAGVGVGVGADGLALGGDEKEIECLTAEEELKLVRYYCRKIMDIATVFEFPTNVKVCSAYSPSRTPSKAMMNR